MNYLQFEELSMMTQPLQPSTTVNLSQLHQIIFQYGDYCLNNLISNEELFFEHVKRCTDESGGSNDYIEPTEDIEDIEDNEDIEDIGEIEDTDSTKDIEYSNRLLDIDSIRSKLEALRDDKDIGEDIDKDIDKDIDEESIELLLYDIGLQSYNENKSIEESNYQLRYKTRDNELIFGNLYSNSLANILLLNSSIFNIYREYGLITFDISYQPQNSVSFIYSKDFLMSSIETFENSQHFEQYDEREEEEEEVDGGRDKAYEEVDGGKDKAYEEICEELYEEVYERVYEGEGVCFTNNSADSIWKENNSYNPFVLLAVVLNSKTFNLSFYFLDFYGYIYSYSEYKIETISSSFLPPVLTHFSCIRNNIPLTDLISREDIIIADYSNYLYCKYLQSCITYALPIKTCYEIYS